MATLVQKIEAERRMRGLLEDNGLPQPDHVEYGFTCIRLFFNRTKTVVIIDLDESPRGPEADVEADVARAASVRSSRRRSIQNRSE
jgi:hypothetical protein